MSAQTRQKTIERRTGSELLSVTCPEVVPLYLQTMRGVDVFAQRQSYSKIGRRSKKWFYSLVWFFMDVAIHNAFILYQKKHAKHSFGEKDFRKELMHELVGNFSARKAKPNARPSLKRPRDALHLPEKVAAQGACRECVVRVGAGRNNARSHWRCEDCHVFLCMPVCYRKHVTALAQQAEEKEHE